MGSHTILILQSGLRVVAEDDALRSLEIRARERPRRVVHVDMRRFSDDIEGGSWEASDRFLRQTAADIRLSTDDLDEPELHYFGLAEVAHMIALGAYLGSERRIVIHELDRDAGSFTWPGGPPRQIEAVGCPPIGYRVTQNGLAVIRVEISAAVTDADLADAVGGERLADVTIRFVGEPPGVAKIRSLDDVEVVRTEFRGALAAVRSAFPNLEEIHLFVAAPASVAFAVGQELVPRNSPAIQTYRHRRTPHSAVQTPAILITGGDAPEEPRRLSPEETSLAQRIRQQIWPKALARISEYAARRSSSSPFWFDQIEPQLIARARPFPALPRISDIVRASVRVASTGPAPEYESDGYHYDSGAGIWAVSDAFVLALNGAAGGNVALLIELIGLFALHEYVHAHQGLTADTVAEVGKFANCLERLDYAADLYALLHHLNVVLEEAPDRLSSEESRKKFLASQVELIIRSFWAFERPDQKIWEVRRLRRHLNWYWRHIQVQRASDLSTAIHLLSSKPSIELAGLRQITRGRRVLVDLSRRDSTTVLELGVVLENERLHRQTSGPGPLNIDQLCEAFVRRDHDTIKRFCRALFDVTNFSKLPS